MTQANPAPGQPGADAVRANYDALYAGSDILRSEAQFYDRAARGLAAQLPAGATVLDVGCGAGYFLAALARHGLRGAGLDISEQGLARARVNAPDADLRLGGAEKLPWPDASCDAVTALGTLEHFLDMDAALREQRRVAKPGAPLLFVVPNRFYLLELWYVLRTGAEIPSPQVLERKDSRRGWEKFLSGHGLTVEKTEAYNNLGDGWSRRGALLRKAIHPFIPLHWSWQFMFWCRNPR